MIQPPLIRFNLDLTGIYTEQVQKLIQLADSSYSASQTATFEQRLAVCRELRHALALSVTNRNPPEE